jgi:hypothetical protein
MKTLNEHLEELFKECKHGDDKHKQWLKDKFDDYFERNADNESLEAENLLFNFCKFLSNENYHINGYDDKQLITIIKIFLKTYKK